MTFVLELRELKKSLPRPVTHFWRRATGVVCALRLRLALLALLCLAFDCPVGGGLAPSGGGLALLCGVLTAAMSATLALVSDASLGLAALLSADTSPGSQLAQTLGLCLGQPLSPFDVCPEAGSFPAFSGYYLGVLAACALLSFGCGLSRTPSTKPSGGR
jgi:hypothetical protein